MATTYGGYAFKTGSTPSETGDAGFVVLSKQLVLQAAGSGASVNQDSTLDLPPGSQILNVFADTTVAHTSTTATLAIGSTVGGAEYYAATDIKAQGRVTFAATTTIAAIQDIGTNTSVKLRLALGTTTTTVGTTYVTVVYIQKR